VLGLVGLEAVADKRVGAFSLGMGQRLGLAAALLGDPGVLLLDEPVNGLDPEGIRWIRTLLQRLAADGRTVFVSSHLMSEMALTADHLIVVGRGRVLADCSTAEFIDRASPAVVKVRSPDATRLRELLQADGVRIASAQPGVLEIDGLTTDAIGERAAAHGLTLHELSSHQGSLEDAFMELTRDALEYQAA
jgi:ABC-2 type transport system ATP-binding protein